MRIKTQETAPFYYQTMLMSSALSDIFMLLQLVVGWKQHDRQCTYNITLRHGPATTAAERKKFYISAGSGCRLADKVVSVAR